MSNINLIKIKLLLSIYPIYNRTSLIGGSILLLFYSIQVISGLLIGMSYSWVFDTGLPGVSYIWWENYFGSYLIRIHSEFGNILFLLLYSHILIKIWNNSYQSELDSTWITGSIILVFIYLTGITGAIMPCSILSEVTATVIGYAINSLSFLNFDFLATFMIPGLGLTDDTLSRTFLIHASVPLIAYIFIYDHLNNLHLTEYTDEDEMEVTFFARFEYWDDFIWVELYCWFEFLIFFIIVRFISDIFIPNYMAISYSLSNFEYWPLTEDIDFSLAIPHWYLRPLMASLVVIPHHYLGFFYVLFFFLAIIQLPFWDENSIITRSELANEYLNTRFAVDLNIFGNFFFCLFVMSLIYSVCIVPTGRYFIASGSSELLVFSFWYIFIYLTVLIRLNIIFMNELRRNLY